MVEFPLGANDIETLEHRDKMQILRSSLSALIERVSETDQQNPPQIYLFGSLGRRIAISQTKNWEGYCQSIQENPKLAPRKGERKIWDADIAVPDQSIPWAELARISRDISKSNIIMEVDPHFIDVNSGNRTFMHRGTLISTNYFKFELQTFDFFINKDQPPIQIPDMWSQLLFYLTSTRLRPRDITEIEMLAEGMVKSGDIKDKTRINRALKIAKNKKKIFSIKNIARWPYWVAVPYSTRVKIAKLRHNEKAYIRNCDKIEPVYV
jgi:hypothetical protein